MEMDDQVLRIELKTTKPVELVDLAASFMAFAESFRDHANTRSGEPIPDNVRLYIKEIRSGSIIADLSALAEQASFILKHAEMFAAFLGNMNEIANYFLGTPKLEEAKKPSPKEAKQLAQILEPVAKDAGSQLNINVAEGGVVNIHQSFHISSRDANAVQNSVARYLGPPLPIDQTLHEQLMVLEQVKNNSASKSGDRGIIEAISHKAVKLHFSSEEIKKSILTQHENPLQGVFMVTVNVRYVSGEPVIYKILEVIDFIPKE